jgi:hypothetical protein
MLRRRFSIRSETASGVLEVMEAEVSSRAQALDDMPTLDSEGGVAPQLLLARIELEKLLFKLDDVRGNQEVKPRRKALVLRVQSILEHCDARVAAVNSTGPQVMIW